jgi:hypothetical protein
MTLTVMTLSMMTLSIRGIYVTLSIRGIYVTFSISDSQSKRHSAFTMLCYYAECRIISTITLNVIMLSVVQPKVVGSNVFDCVAITSLLVMATLDSVTHTHTHMKNVSWTNLSLHNKAWGLYYKTLRIRKLRKMDRFCSNLVSFL